MIGNEEAVEGRSKDRQYWSPGILRCFETAEIQCYTCGVETSHRQEGTSHQAAKAQEGEQVMIDVNAANSQALQRLFEAEPLLVGMGKAIDTIPGMKDKMLLHAGPHITHERMSGPLIGAVTGAAIYEGWADSVEEAKEILSSGAITFEPCHEHAAVGPMAGVISPRMPVYIVENRRFGNRSYATMNEGLGRVLRMGAFDDSVIAHLRWMETSLFPVLKEAIEKRNDAEGPIDLKNIIAQALHMGDELHNRNKAGTSLLFRSLAPNLAETCNSGESLSRVLRFIDSNDHFFLNLGMASAKASLDPLNGIEGSTIVYIMARNGTDFGIKVSGLGDVWFTCAAAQPDVLLFPGFTRDDVNPDIGDSAIMETYGIGGFALAAAPAIVQFVGGTPADAIRYTREMYEICADENKSFTIPQLNFTGTPTGIDLLKVVESGITPILDTGAAHKVPGKGQVGAGIVRMPSEAFVSAAEAFAEKYA